MKLATLAVSTLLLAACEHETGRKLWLDRGLTEAQVILQEQEPDPF